MDFREFKAFMDKAMPGACGIEQFEKMEALLRDWNTKINVISRKDMDGIFLHHIVHSLAIAGYMSVRRPDCANDFMEGSTVLDIGTGGGFPGIPLAIIYPRTKFTLCDSVGKKILVARSIAEELGLQNVETRNCRAESIDGTFDYVVSRAVTSLDNFYPWAAGKFKKDIFYLKGGDIAEEIAAMMGKYRLPNGCASTWKIREWADYEHFEGKLVVDIKAV